MIDGPAFILGNGPDLPVGELHCLARRLTVGVNRIVLAFEPTVVMWVDASVYADAGERIDRCGALAVCGRAVRRRREHVGLEVVTGERALRRPAGPGVLCCNGSTGCCAARWAASLGCRPVYLVGMGAAYRDGRTNFYGRNPRHRFAGRISTLTVLRGELERLRRDLPDVVAPIADAQTLRETAAACPPVDQRAARDRIRALLTRRAAAAAE